MPRNTGLAALVAVALAGPAVATAQEPVTYPRLRAALHELRDARNTLTVMADEAHNPLKERALASTQDAINSIKVILAVRDVKDFRGVDRTPDYYKRYPNYPRARAALDDLREARDELRTAKAGTAAEREQALDDIDVAVADIIRLIRAAQRSKQ